MSIKKLVYFRLPHLAVFRENAPKAGSSAYHSIPKPSPMNGEIRNPVFAELGSVGAFHDGRVTPQPFGRVMLWRYVI